MPLPPVSAGTESTGVTSISASLPPRRKVTFTAVGASTSGEAGSFIQFNDSTTAASGTFVINGSTAQDVAGAVLNFFDNSTAGNATITANGGSKWGRGWRNYL